MRSPPSLFVFFSFYITYMVSFEAEDVKLNHTSERGMFEFALIHVCAHVRSRGSVCLWSCLAPSSPLRLMPQMASRLSHIVMLQCVNSRNYKWCADTLLKSICGDGRERTERGDFLSFFFFFFFFPSGDENGWKGFLSWMEILRAGSEETSWRKFKDKDAASERKKKKFDIYIYIYIFFFFFFLPRESSRGNRAACVFLHKYFMSFHSGLQLEHLLALFQLLKSKMCTGFSQRTFFFPVSPFFPFLFHTHTRRMEITHFCCFFFFP